MPCSARINGTPISSLPEQRAALRVGGLVLVPFGNGNRQMLAVVAGFSSSSEYKNLKTVITPVDSPAEIDEDTVELCQFIKSRAFCTFGAALRAVLPRGLSVMTEEVYSPGDVRRETDGLEGEIAEYILASDRDEITRRELHSRFGDESAAALVRLVSDGIIRKRVRVVYRNNEKTVKTVSPALGEAELSEYLDGSRRTGSKKRLELLFALAEHGTLTLNELADAYGISAQVVNGAQKEGLVTVGVRRVSRTAVRREGMPSAGGETAYRASAGGGGHSFPACGFTVGSCRAFIRRDRQRKDESYNRMRKTGA